jgi:hypothetical protein
MSTGDKNYDAHLVDTLPIIKPCILTDDWIQIQLDEKYILSNDIQVKIVDRSNFWCYPDQNTLCQVCVTRRVEHRPPSQCFISLISKHKLAQLLNYCDFKKLKQIWDQAIFLTDKIIAYVNPVPGSIVARCPDKQPEHTQLMPYGYISLDPTCTYDIVNGPLSEKDEYISSLTVLNNNQRGTTSLNINNEEAFRTH